MWAVYQALKYIVNFGTQNDHYTIYADSKIVVDGINGFCARNANTDVWALIEDACNTICDKDLNVDVCHVAGHAGHLGNETADRLAKSASNSLLIHNTEIKTTTTE